MNGHFKSKAYNSVRWACLVSLAPKREKRKYHSVWYYLRCNEPRIRWCRTGGFQEQSQCFFIGLSCSIPTIVLYFFSVSLFFLSIGWYFGAGFFGLIGCIPLSLSLALPTFFNNNNNRTWGTHTRVFSQTLAHGNSKNEIRQ